MTSKNNSVPQRTELEKLHASVHRTTDLFPGQLDTEVVQLLVRPHWIREVLIFLRFFLLAVVVPIIFLYFLSLFRTGEGSLSIINLLLFTYLLFVWLFTFIEYEKNELTVLVVTNERVVDVDQLSLFKRQVSEANLTRIQEVSGFVHGMLGTFFDIGKLEIQTAGTDLPLVTHYVKSPNLTARKILDIQRELGGDFTERRRTGEKFSQDKLRKMRKPGTTIDARPSSKKGDYI